MVRSDEAPDDCSVGWICDPSLKEIREGCMKGHVTKYDFEKALRAQKELNMR